ncbi:hypothetical protein [Nocardia thailandica]
MSATIAYHPDRARANDQLLKRVRLDRAFSTRGWNVVAAVAETHPAITVPRTTEGDIDWKKASRIRPEPEAVPPGQTQAPPVIAGITFRPYDSPAFTLDEILVQLADQIDLSHITGDTAARITAPTPVPALTPDQVSVDLGDTTARIVGYLRMGEQTSPAPGTLVYGFDIHPDLDDSHNPVSMALIERSRHAVITVTAEGTVSLRGAETGPDDPHRAPTWFELYPVDRHPATGGYHLSRRQLLHDSCQISAPPAIAEALERTPLTITTLYR